MVNSEGENKFPDCLSIKLHGKPLVASWLKRFFISKSQENLTDQINLQLTIRFGEQQIPVLGGTVKFGLRGGELKLNLINCTIPLENQGLTPPLLAKIEMEKQIENTEGIEDSLALTLRGGITIKGNQTTKEGVKFKDDIYQVYTQGTDEKPVWVFQLQTDKKIFIGGWQKEKIGILQINAKPYSVEGLFEVKKEDIRLTSATGIWSKDIGRNKTAWLQRELLLSWLKPKLQPYISRAELFYE
jgi:hypothetical protein